jgi:nitroimidazol reductase NimA-like FMN-containing flavoprotein (pyridoxamine 5'-phosphate oxidase superfamily)
MPVGSEVEELLSGAMCMLNLATSVNDHPHVAPVWYAYHDDTLSVLTSGKKLANIQQNPRVAGSIEKNTDGDAEWKVTLLGTATVSDEPTRVNEAAEQIFSKYLGPDEEQWSDYYRQALTDNPSHTLVEIHIGSADVSRY